MVPTITNTGGYTVDNNDNHQSLNAKQGPWRNIMVRNATKTLTTPAGTVSTHEITVKSIVLPMLSQNIQKRMEYVGTVWVKSGYPKMGWFPMVYD